MSESLQEKIRRRQKYNSMMMLVVIIFIGVFNLPALLKHYQSDPPDVTHPYVINPYATIKNIAFPRGVLSQDKNGHWKVDDVPDQDFSRLTENWKLLVGTHVPAELYDQLKLKKLTEPSSMTVTFEEESVAPQTIIFYKTDEFWLFYNWQQRWVAVSGSAENLFPKPWLL